MAGSEAEPFDGGEFFESHGAAGADFVGADPDFCAHTELVTVGEAGGGVPVDGGGVDGGEEFPGGGFVGSDDAIGVVAAVAVDVMDGGVDALDRADIEDEVVIFRVVVLVGGGFEVEGGGVERFGGLEDFEAFGVGAEFDVMLGEGFGDDGEECFGGGGIDEESFHGVTDAGALGFGVDGDGFGHVGVSVTVEVGMADAFVVFDDGDFGAIGYGADEAFASARHTEVDEVGEGEEFGYSGAVGGGDDLDGVFGELGQVFLGGIDHDFGDELIGVEGFFTAAEDGGVAGFEAEAGGVGGDVGSGFIDDDDDADGHGDLLEAEAIGSGTFIEGAADGVGEGGDFAEALGHGLDAGVGESEPVEHGLAEAHFGGGGEVFLVGELEFV
ncbi:MAG: hypothetical protein RI897_3864 [Verrucomicrobiota bacterium]